MISAKCFVILGKTERKSEVFRGKIGTLKPNKLKN